MNEVKKPIVVIDTNIFWHAIKGQDYESRILKDAVNGSSFDYRITMTQPTDIENSENPNIVRHKDKMLKAIEHYSMGMLGKGRYDSALRKMMWAAEDVEKSDIEMVEDALKADALCLVSNDKRLVEACSEDVFLSLSQMNPQLYGGMCFSVYMGPDFCMRYDDRIVTLSPLEKIKNRLKRKVFDWSGKIL